MDWGWVPIVVAFIAGPVMYMLKRFERRNDQQHASNLEILHEIKTDVHENRQDVRELRADVRGLKADHRLLKFEVGKIRRVESSDSGSVYE
jgi:hypothetical protein